MTSTVDDLSKQEQIDVQVETVDAYVKKNNIKKINLLKIDVQGFEDEVLKGAQETLNLIYPYGYKFFALTCTNIETYSLNLWKLPELQFDVIYTSNVIYDEYVKGSNCFENSMWYYPGELYPNLDVLDIFF